MFRPLQKIDISPLSNMNGDMCMVLPIAPGDLWVYDLFECVIFDWSGTVQLHACDDDRGLGARVSNLHYDGDNDGDVRFVLFGCPSAQEGIPSLSNKIIIYDVYDNKCTTMGPNAAAHFGRDTRCVDTDVVVAPFVSWNSDNMDRFYASESSLLRWGRVSCPNPLLLRSLRSGAPPRYKLIDPFMQWAPARFMQMGDDIDYASTDTENWAAMIVDNLNWDYFSSVYGYRMYDQSSVDIAAAIFDMLYTDYIYPSICKRIWLKEAPGGSSDNLPTARPIRSVIVNFTDIVNQIRLKMARHLKCRIDDDIPRVAKTSRAISTDELRELDISRLLA